MRCIYEPKPGRLMRVAVLFSGGASALQYLLQNDPNLHVKYEFVGAFTDRATAPGIAQVRRAGIPLEVLDFREFLARRRATPKDEKARHEYFAQVIERIAPWQPDILMLSGFMLIITEPLLSAYRHRILNVHPGDLSIVDEQGQRKYVGQDAVAQAIRAGERHTRSTIHLVTEGVDAGPIVVMSEPLEVREGISAEEHQEQMKWACDGPAYQRALGLIAQGRVWLDEEEGRVEIR